MYIIHGLSLYKDIVSSEKEGVGEGVLHFYCDVGTYIFLLWKLALLL